MSRGLVAGQAPRVNCVRGLEVVPAIRLQTLPPDPTRSRPLALLARLGFALRPR